MKLLKSLFLVLIALPSWGLDLNESLETRILRVLPNGTVVINRGAEDYINDKEHVKLMIGEKFIARAVAVQVSMGVTYLKLYRIANPDLVNTDRDYQVKAINTSQVPIYVEEKVSTEKYYADLAAEEQRIAMGISNNNKQLTTDLPPEMDAVPPEKWYRYMNNELKPYEKKEYEERTVSEGLDFDNLYFSAFASPYLIQRVNDNRNINYGLSVGTKRNEKYELTLSFNQTSSSSRSQFDDAQATFFSTSANLVFDINRIKPWLTYFMLGSFYRERNSTSLDDDGFGNNLFGDIYPVKQQLRLGLAGLKFHITEDQPTVKKFDISYITLLEKRVSEIIVQDPNFINPPFVQEETNNTIRHSLRLRLFAQMTDKIFVTNTLFWRPLMENFEIDFKDVDMNNRFSLSYQINQNIFFDYVNTYTNDIRLERDNGIEPINIIHQFNLRYEVQ